MHYRKRLRRPEHDYSKNGMYFVTFKTYKNVKWFGRVENGVMCVNRFGQIIHECWSDLSYHYKTCDFHEFIVMPEHIHCIIEINNSKSSETKNVTLSTVVSSLKSFSSRNINKVNKTGKQFGWHRSFHEYEITNKYMMKNMKKYIIKNPQRYRA